MRNGHTSTLISALLPLLMLILSTEPMFAGTKIKLASVPPIYLPTAGNGLPEPVSMDGFAFEFNRETERARIVVDYTYPDQPTFGSDGGAGPPPTIVQVPGLSYDPTQAAIIYNGGGQRTVCATIQERRRLFRRRSRAVPTGACVVTSRTVDRPVDDGWSIRRVRTIDTFLEIR